MLVEDALVTFREIKCLSKEFRQMTIQELSDKPSSILDLSNALRGGMKPKSKFKLPYKKEQREQELIDNISENYAIDKNKTRVKIVTGNYKDVNTGQEFNYALEVAIAPRTDIGVENAGAIDFIGNINCTPSIDGGEKYFQGTYVWTNRQGVPAIKTSIKEILQECGFNTSRYINISKKKVPAVVYINLNTPCPDWLGSAGKTHIDLRPYAEDIVKTVSALAHKMPSYHGRGFGAPSCFDSYRGEEDIAKRYLEDFLRKRYDAVGSDPSLKTKDRLTQSGVWYRIRPIMINSDFTPTKDWGTTRRTLQGSINKVCAELFGDDVKREDLGIIAAARATMLFDGQAYPVTLDNIQELASKGVAIVVIEKEGIADIIAAYAQRYGVALVHTQGRLTEYGKDLIEESSSTVVILTDYDAYGMQIAEETINEIPRIGIDMETIEWLQQNGYPDLKKEDVEEEYSPNIWTGDEYLKQHRIELDSIVAKVGAEGLWKYIIYKLELHALEGFDYNNVIPQTDDEEIYPEAISKLQSRLNNYIGRITRNEREAIAEKQGAVKKLIPIKDYEKENSLKLRKIVAEDAVMCDDIIPAIEKLLETLPSPNTEKPANSI